MKYQPQEYPPVKVLTTNGSGGAEVSEYTKLELQQAIHAEQRQLTVKVIYELSDGGLVEATDETPVPMGDSGEYAYRQLTYTNGCCRIVFEVTDGLPGCSSITLAAQGRPVRAKDLAAVKLDAIRDEAFRAVGLLVADPDGAHDAPPRLVQKVVNTATSRRRVTPEFLRQVASVCESVDGDSTQDRIEAVKAALGVTERSAYRYIAAAKEKGYIR